MSRIGAFDMLLVDDLFEANPDYVLDFSYRTFADFFARELNIDIYDDAFAKNGTSNPNRLRYYLQAAKSKVTAHTRIESTAIYTGAFRRDERCLAERT